MTLKCFALSSLIFLVLVTSASAQTLFPSDVRARLTLAEPKTVYKIGEPIKLIMEFTADREGYVAELISDRKEQWGDDTVVVSPEFGITHWLEEMTGGRRYLRDMGWSANLSNVPKRVGLILNDTLRFDMPGRYTVTVTTKRVTKHSVLGSRTIILKTNPITFEVVPMSYADEDAEVKRLADRLDAKRNWRDEEEFGQPLSFLTGEPSTREKVRRFLNMDERSGNLNTHLWYGLFIASNRHLVVKLLEEGLRDPNTPVSSQLLIALTMLRVFVTYGAKTDKPVVVNAMMYPGEEEDPRAREIRDSYVVELAAGLDKRKDKALTTTAITIASNLPKDSQTASVGSSEARRIIIQQFDTLQPTGQEWLLRQDWAELRDRSMIPVFKRVLRTGPAHKHIHEAALKLLKEVAPDEVRPFVVAEIRDPMSFVDVKLLGSIEAKSLPEADASLLEEIRRLVAIPNNHGFVFLKQKISLLVRFGSDGIYQELMDLYQKVGPKLYADGRAGLLAYFAKHNEREALPLIEQAITESKGEEGSDVLRYLTELYYSEAIGDLVKKRLATDDLSWASNAAYLIGLHGSPEDQKVLEARLKRWQEEWGNRVAEADAQQQGRIERELVWALIHGKSWKFPPARVKELQLGCITQICKQSNPVK